VYSNFAVQFLERSSPFPTYSRRTTDGRPYNTAGAEPLPYNNYLKIFLTVKEQLIIDK